MRNAYLEKLYELAGKDKNVMALISDNGAIVYDRYRHDFPDQYMNFGIAEANMVAAAAGMASRGKIPFAYTIGAFLAYRALEFIRNDVCYQNQNVKIVGIGAGEVYSTLGPTHHTTEDLGVLRALPNLVILCPASPMEVRQATLAAYEYQGPVYLRLGTKGETEIYEQENPFKIGKGVILKDGEDVALVSTGSMVKDVLNASVLLAKDGIQARIINIHTLKPFDRTLLEKTVEDIGRVLTVEDHNVIGGLGSTVAEVLAEYGKPVKFHRMGLQSFSEGYGSYLDVKRQNGLGIENICREAKKLCE